MLGGGAATARPVRGFEGRICAENRLVGAALSFCYLFPWANKEKVSKGLIERKKTWNEIL